jgi:molybdate transport system permease protein
VSSSHPPKAPARGYNRVEAMEYANAHVLSGILLAFSFVVLLTLYTLNRKRQAS